MSKSDFMARMQKVGRLSGFNLVSGKTFDGSTPGMSFYETDEWRALRYRALTLCGGACQCCGNRPTPRNPLHVDHIKPRSRFPELELDIRNLQVLCKDCNLGKGAHDQTDWRSK